MSRLSGYPVEASRLFALLLPDCRKPMVANLPEPVRQAVAPLTSSLSKWLLFQDPPQHTPVRRLVNQALSAKMAQTQQTVQEMSDYFATLIANCIALVFAGHETTTYLIANAWLTLQNRPEQLQWLRALSSLPVGFDA